MHLATKTLALSFAAAAGLSSFNALTPSSAEAVTRCDSGTLLGRYTLKSKLNNKFVRAGIGSGSYVGAKSNNVGGNTSWETFDIYDLGNRDGLNGGTYALRSTQDPNRWVSVNSQNALKLMNGCNTASKNRLFRANRVSNILQLQSLFNQQWVIQRSDNMLYANAPTTGGNVPKALQYKLTRIGAGPSTPVTPAQANINGWFRGNNSGYYTAQSSGGSFQMKAFTNTGKLLNLFQGTISGNRVTGTWRNYCNNGSGNATLVYENGSLRRIAGNTRNLSWSPINRPNIQLESQPSCNTPTPTPQQTSEQRLTLKREILVYDQNMFGSNQRGTTTKVDSITIERPTSTPSNLIEIARATKRFPNGKHCVGNTNSVDKGSVYLNRDGKAYFNFEIKLREGSCNGGVRIGSESRSRFLTAAPGETKSRSIRVNGVGGSKVQITYTLTNRTN